MTDDYDVGVLRIEMAKAKKRIETLEKDFEHLRKHVDRLYLSSALYKEDYPRQ